MRSELFNAFQVFEDSAEVRYYDKETKFPNPLLNYSELPPNYQSMLIQEFSTIDNFHYPDNIENCLAILLKRVSNITDEPGKQENPASPIILYLLRLFQRAERPAKLNRLVISFILTAMARSSVFDKVFYDNDFNPNDQTSLLFSNDLFPDNPTDEHCEFDYVKKTCLLLFKWASTTSEKGQLFLFDQILNFSYSSNSPKQKIYNFLPFFVQIINDESHPQLYEVFMKTKLFSKILTESKSDILLFDLVRLFIEKQPFKSLQLNNDLQVQLANFSFLKSYKKTINEIISESLKYIIETEKKEMINNDQMIVIKIIENILKECNKEEGRQSEIEEVYPSLIQFFPQVSNHLFEFIIKENIFEDLALVSIFSQSLFQNYITLITKMYIYHYEFGYRMSSRKYKVYEILKGYKGEFPLFEYFEKLSYCSEKVIGENKYLRNYKGIELMVSLSHLMGEKEKDFSRFLLARSLNAGNLLELNRAKVPDFILKRLNEIDSDDEIVSNYLDLFKRITNVVFNNASFYRTIETIGQKSFKYGNEIIDIIKELLVKNKHNKKYQKENNKDVEEEEPASFIRLDASLECGIFYPQLWTNSINNFSISFCIRVNQIKNESLDNSNELVGIPLLSIQSTTSNAKIGLEIGQGENDQGEIYLVERNEKNKETRSNLQVKVEQGRWEFFQIIIKKHMIKKEMFIIHNKQEMAPIKLSNSIPQNGYILIGCDSKEEKSPSLMCDVSTILIAEGVERTNRHSILHTDELKTNDHIISELNPTNCHEGIGLDTYNNSQETIKYRGRSIPFVPSIYEVFQTVGSLTNILPLFERNQKNNEDTTRFYISLIKIFQEMVHVTENVKEIFLESCFFELLLSFLLGVKSEYLTIELIQEVFNLYDEIFPIEELRYQMSQYIILNYYFIMYLENDVLEKVVNELLPTIIKDSNTDAYHYSYLPSFMYQTYEYFSDKDDISESAWKILDNMIKHNLSYIKSEFDENVRKNLANKYIMMVFRLMMNLETEYSIIKSLEVLISLLRENYYEEAKECLKQESIYSHLTELMSQKSPVIQILTLEIIDIIKKEIDLHKAVYQCASEFVDRKNISEKFVNKVFSLFIVYDGNNNLIKFNADYLPLLSVCGSAYSKRDKKRIIEICEKINEFLNTNKDESQALLSVPCWYDLLRDLYKSVYDPSTECSMFSLPFSYLFVKEFRNCNVEPISKFFYSLDYSDIENTRSIKRFILSNLIHENQINQKQIINILPLIFDHLIFEKTTTLNSDESSCTIKIRDIEKSKVDEEDTSLVDSLVSTILENPIDSDKETIVIGNALNLNIILTLSILSSGFLSANSNLYIKVLGMIRNNLNGKDKELCFQCSSILVEPFIDHEFTENEEELKKEIESFDQFLIRKGKSVKNEIIIKEKNKIIENIYRFYLALQGFYLTSAHEVIKERFLDKDKNSRPDDDEDEEERRAKDDRLLALLRQFDFTKSMIVSKNSHIVKFEDRKFKLYRCKKFRSENKRIVLMKESFLRSMSKMPGPWLNEKDRDAKYKAFNCISKKGQRILLKINNHFQNHEEEIKNTKKIEMTEEDKKNQKEQINEFIIPTNISKSNDDEEEVFYLEINQFNVTLQKISEKFNGLLKFTDKTILFISNTNQPEDKENTTSIGTNEFEENDNSDPSKKVTINFKNITFILNRKVVREEKACEIFLNNYKSYFIVFTNNKERNRFYQEIDRLVKQNELYNENNNNKFDFFNSLLLKCNCVYQNKASSDLVKEINLTALWQNQKITNYEYIYYLNMLSGRSFNYQNQYPIFPVLIKECNKEEIDILNDNSIYRNLEDPPIKLNKENFEMIQSTLFDNYEEFNTLQQKVPSTGEDPSKFLLRVEPFTTYQTVFHKSNGKKKFDSIDRMFYSIPRILDNGYNKPDVPFLSELIPEFYTLPAMMVNENNFNFGERTQDPIVPIGNVILPPWCRFKGKKNDDDDGNQNENSLLLNSYIFTSVNRIALECEYASKNLNKWIDLYFTEGRGFIKKRKVSYRIHEQYAYPEETDVEDYMEMKESFGMLPEILFKDPHPPKLPQKQNQQQQKQHQQFPKNINLAAINIVKCVAHCKDSCIVDLLSHNNADLKKLPDTIGDLQCIVRHHKTRKSNSNNNTNTNSNNVNNEDEISGLAVFCTKSNPFVTVANLSGPLNLRAECHIQSAVTSVCSIGGRFLITGSSDCTVSLWRLSFKGNENDDFEIIPVSSSSFHSDEVVTVCGCYENGLVVSLDKKNVLVFETILNAKFINFVDLNNGKEKVDRKSVMKTKIIVFKSGIVAVAQIDRVFFFDSHGKKIYTWMIQDCDEIMEMRKFYDCDTREIVIVGCRNNEKTKICVFDLATFSLVGNEIEINFDHFCPMKNVKKIIVSDSNKLSIVDF